MAAPAQMTSDIVPLYPFILLSTFRTANARQEEEEGGEAWGELSGGAKGHCCRVSPEGESKRG